MEYLTTALSAASSLASRSALSSSYTLHSSSPNSPTTPLQIGVWRVEQATHNSNGKKVSIWSAEKSSLVQASGRGKDANTQRRLDKAVEVLKKEASSLSRLRHPCILEMAEPMEETRSSITFATEPITSSLRSAISASSSSSSRRRAGGEGEDDLELDEVEIQKGLSQLAKGLQFLHESAKLVHGNLTPEAVVINAKGDWKLSGFGLSTYLFDPQTGVPAKWQFLEYDHALPPSLQRDLDYVAPEYLLDETAPSPSNDMYSLGLLLHTLHLPPTPPFSFHTSLSSARSTLESSLSPARPLPQWRKLSPEVQEVLGGLVTRYPSRRLSAREFEASSYFQSLLVGTLNFLSREGFNAQSGEAQTGFLKGLIQVLPRFSAKVNRRKVLPSLLEETRKPNLVPFLLPNILYIAAGMDEDSFRTQVLPSLKPLFSIKDPPQAVISLLDNMGIFVEKCEKGVFREEVMPLIYFALESDNPIVLERALKVVPGLSETLDYTTVKQTLFPKITAVFTKTTMLSVKVNTLICFHSMIQILDKFTLTEKLVPLLAKIKTKEPAVMIATLAVHEAMGSKVEIEAIATLILPQLWAMSMGPLLNAGQFAKFMSVIKRLGTRVEEEHSRQLGELRRLEESSAGAGVNGGAGGGGEVMDFESLVRGGGLGVNGVGAKKVANDVWGEESPRSLTPNAFSPPITPTLSPNPPPSSFAPAPAFHNPPRPNPTSRLSTSSSSSRALGARTVPPTSFNSTAFPQPTPTSPPLPALPPPGQQSPSFPSSFPVAVASPPPPPTTAGLKNFAALQPSRPGLGSPAASSNSVASQPASMSSSSYSTGRPNYDLGPTSTSAAPSSIFTAPPPAPAAAKPSWNVLPPVSSPAPSPSMPPGFAPGGVLQPKVVAPKKVEGQNFGAWKDFDPLG
ncbi:hypothetical protein BCR35DRAFT_308461 [Leucosporidium creatinivorum]|uniref:Protein kinase domain-containing protein n=1 Tax=Leucosporidium creatinivorum TaxID=106004 RepID=A0A1Y2E5G4_9BASI|nr:hypothetical protein BCR35DRAFT_308461 [Leucosporidium creatinivorum]